jgi:carbonic anhydrase
MSIIDDVLRANSDYASEFRAGALPSTPARKLAILACMDARLTIQSMLGLNAGDANIIRNAGGIATEDAIRSLIVSHHKLGTREIMVVNHTDCGMMAFNDEDFERQLVDQTGEAAIAPSRFYSFSDVEQNVREQVNKIRSHPWIPAEITVRGFVYDVKTGRLHEVRVTDVAKAA